MTKWVMLPFIVMPWAVCLRAQLNLLTLREAESVVERIPTVAAANQKGECPQFSAMYSGADELAIQVRSGCGPNGGTLIGYYTVNRRTGEVALWGDNPQPVANRQGEAFARQLILQAQTRVLSTSDARCLALEATRSLPGWNETSGSLSVEEIGKADHEQVQFSARYRSSVRRADSGRVLTVDTTNARVRDNETGLELMSQGLGSLTSKILALRTPRWLTDEDAISIALAIPAVVASLRDDCRLFTGGAFRSEQAIVGIFCQSQNTDGGPAVSVDLKTGQVMDAAGKPIESAEAVRLARQLLERIDRQRSELQKDVEAACRPR